MGNKKYRYQVNTFGDPEGSWAGNAVTFETADAAELAARDLFQRWTAVKNWRVIDDTGTILAQSEY